MKKQITSTLRVLTLLCILVKSFSANSQISGTVFRDYNGNGTRQTASPITEPLQAGVIVNAYNSDEVLLATKTTTSASAPNYSFSIGEIPAATKVRLEFIIPTSSSTACNLGNSFEYPALSGSAYGSNVQFSTGGSTNVNFAVANSTEYITTSNPNVFTYFSYSGDPLSTSGTGTRAFDRTSIVRYPYSITGGPTAPSVSIQAQYVGSTYGIAYSKQASKLFSSAYLQHYIGLGPQGSGGIYLMDTALATTTPNFYDLDANSIPTRGTGSFGAGTSYSVGSTTTLTYLGSTSSVSGHPSGFDIIGSNSARGLVTPVATPVADPSAVGQVGCLGIGDIDISDDGQYIYVTNLYDRKIYRLTLNNAYNPTSVTATTSYTIPNPPLRGSVPGGTGGGYSATYTGATNTAGFYDGTVGFQRPFAIKPYRGKLYIGTVTTGEFGGATTTDNNSGNPEYTDLWAYVWEMDLVTGIFTSTPVLQFPLNYDKGTNSDGINETWKIWDMDFSASIAGCCNLRHNSQPMFTDIEFDAVDGSMIIAIRDRSGDQLKYEQLYLNSTGLVGGWAYGELLRAYKSPSGGCIFEIESNGKEGPSSSKAATAGAGNGGGPGGGEFYYQDNCCPNNHLNLCAGSLAVQPGRNEVLATFADPSVFWSNGFARFNNTDGTKSATFTTYTNATPGTAGKSSGMGDIELIGGESPVEIGNSVWNDANGDGVQNADEIGISNVTLEIFADFNNDNAPDGVSLGSTTTSAGGNFYFSRSNITDGDPTVGGNQPGPQFGKKYLIRIATSDWTSGAGTGDLLNFRLTPSNRTDGAGVDDEIDNDATIVSTIPQIGITVGLSGQNNYSLDFGFNNLAQIGNRVWRDDDNDGNQDAGEPGVAGIAIELYRDHNNDADFNDANENVAYATTTTDAYGAYLFDNIPTGNYRVKFALPPNYLFTTQTNTVDNTNGTQTLATGSDANSTGLTYTIVITGLESELNIDAGIVFDAPPATASVGDRVWYDLNSNGTQNAGEPGVSGVTVTLYSAGVSVSSTLTNASGNYLFTNVTPAANYRVGFALPSGMIFTTNSGAITVTDNSDAITSGVNFGKSTSFTVNASDDIRYIDAGIVPQSATNASLGDYVWEDIDRDGIQDAGEPGISAITVNLLNGASTLIATTVTDAYGYYTFNDLTPATYFVQFVKPAGYNFSNKDQGSNDATDSEADTTTGITGNINLGSGARISTIDAGMYNRVTVGTRASLGDYVWFDYDRDGVQDPTERGIGGVTVTLLNSSGTAIGYTTTDVSGFYKFVNLTPGNYSVQFSNLPEGYTFTGKDLGGNDALDSDADPANGKTAQVTLAAGNNNTDLDAGLLQGLPAGKGSIGNRVWYDMDNDGIQDIDETGTPGVTATLRTAGVDGIQGNGDDVTIGSKVTNELGEFIFTQLDANNYYIIYSNLNVAAPGFAASPQNAGSDDAVDSDGGVISSGSSTTGLYSVAQGEDNMTMDLGLYKAPSSTNNTFGNYVWFDTNNDGLFTAGEPGTPGVMVTLLNASGTVYDSDATTAGIQPLIAVTNANGYYMFTNLPDGSYAAQFSNLPNGFSFNTANVGGNDNIDSDPSTVTGKTAPIVLNGTNPSGTPRLDISLDAGIVTTTAALGNFVWLDNDGDGIQDGGEPGVSGVTVTLYDNTGVTVLATAITDQNGYYFFPNITAGTSYVVGFSTIPSNMEFTVQDASAEVLGNDNDANPATGKTAALSLTAGEVNLNIDAGLRQPLTASVGDFVWNDINSNGVQDGGEAPIPGVIATLWTSGVDGIQDNGGGDDVVLGSAVTNGNGYYLLTNVPPGTNYYIIFSSKPTGNYTTQNVGGTSATNNSKASILGITTPFNLSAGGLVLNLDAGINSLVPLPIHLLAMNCEPNQQGTLVTWTVGDETDVVKYMLQRTSGNTWVTVATLNAKGGIAGNHYSFLDKTAEQGVQTYRLKVASTNGTLSEDGKCISNLQSTGNALSIIPNPTTGNSTVVLQANEDGKASIQVISTLGKELMKGIWFIAEGRNQILLDLSQFAPGTYIVKATTTSGVFTTKVVKQ